MKRIILLTAALSVIGAGLFMSRSVLAQDSPENPMASLVQKIADKFGLNKDDVQAVFDEHREERQAEMETKREENRENMQAKFEEQLSQDVTDGKITEEQKQLIVEKRKEIEENRQSQMDTMKDLSDEERKAAMEAQRAELEAWADENGVDIKYVMGGMGMKGPGGLGGPGRPGPEGNGAFSPLTSPASD